MKLTDIHIGDVFEDQGSRVPSPPQLRRFRVIGFESAPLTTLIVVEDSVTKRKTKIRWDRLLRGGQRGYRRCYDRLLTLRREIPSPCACEGRELVLNAGATPVYFRGKTPYINAGCINLGWGAEANPKLKEGESVEVLVLLPALEEEP